MTKPEHLLSITTEECAEVSQRATKALRFGLNETQTGQDRTNARRLRYEFSDLLGVYELMEEEGMVTWPIRKEINAKKTKVRKFLKYSKKIGSLHD